KDWGFEMRSISTWLQSPKIALAMLCLAKVVIQEVVNNRSNFKFKSYVAPQDYLEMNQDKLYELFPEIWADIKKMHAYTHYKDYLQIIPQLIKRKYHTTNC